MDAKDAAGMTLAEVNKLTLEEEFNLFGKRYAHMQELLRDAQLQINDSPWLWNGGDTLPVSGGSGGVSGGMPGSDDTNSYYLTAGRITQPSEASGAKSDLNPMRTYFEAKGWGIELKEISGDFHLWATTGDGWQLEYIVQENGYYSLSVFSELFWTNDASALLRAIGDRDPANFPEESLPGVFEPFPKWSDPLLR